MDLSQIKAELEEVKAKMKQVEGEIAQTKAQVDQVTAEYSNQQGKSGGTSGMFETPYRAFSFKIVVCLALLIEGDIQRVRIALFVYFRRSTQGVRSGSYQHSSEADSTAWDHAGPIAPKRRVADTGLVGPDGSRQRGPYVIFNVHRSVACLFRSSESDQRLGGQSVSSRRRKRHAGIRRFDRREEDFNRSTLVVQASQILQDPRNKWPRPQCSMHIHQQKVGFRHTSSKWSSRCFDASNKSHPRKQFPGTGMTFSLRGCVINC